MSDTPERIWACIAHDGRLLGITQWPVELWSEYTRTDLIQPMIDAAVAASLEEAATVQVRNGFDDQVTHELHPMLAAAIRALIPKKKRTRRTDRRTEG